MKRLFETVLGLAVMGTPFADADLILVDDTFSTSGMVTSERFVNSNIDQNSWIQRRTGGPDWTISGGVLSNPALNENDEQGAHRMDSVSSTDTTLGEITVSFDYSVGAGDMLYYHSGLFTGPRVASMSNRLTQKNGSTFMTDWSADFLGSEYRLDDAGALSNSAGNAVVSFAGGSSGTYTMTFDISNYDGTGTFSVADVTHVLNVFTMNNTAGGVPVSIDNFNMTAVPEPATAGLLGLGAGLAMLLRRRRNR